MSNKTPAMILQELAIKITRTSPVFTPVSVVQGAHENEFWCKVEVLGIDAIGKGRTKKEAKQESARKALALLKEKGLYEGDEKISSPHFRENDDCEDTELKKVSNYKGDLKEICFHHNLPAPEFLEISAVGPPHAREFTYECSIPNSIKIRATANTKKLARQIVAREMVEILNQTIPNANHVINDQQIKVWEADAAAKEAFHELKLLGKNYGIKMTDFQHTLSDLVKKLNIEPSELDEYFNKEPTEETLDELLKKLNLTYETEEYEYNGVYTDVVKVNMDWTMTTMEQADNSSLARSKAVQQMLKTIKHLID